MNLIKENFKEVDINSITDELVFSKGSNKPTRIRKPKVYRALISQEGEDAPTVIIQENTLGNIIWTRFGVGDYRGTLKGAFPLLKTRYNIPPTVTGTDYGQIYAIGRISDNVVQVESFSTPGNAADESFAYFPIEFIVYN